MVYSIDSVDVLPDVALDMLHPYGSTALIYNHVFLVVVN
jgi:hypothetical protein